MITLRNISAGIIFGAVVLNTTSAQANDGVYPQSDAEDKYCSAPAEERHPLVQNFCHAMAGHQRIFDMMTERCNAKDESEVAGCLTDRNTHYKNSVEQLTKRAANSFKRVDRETEKPVRDMHKGKKDGCFDNECALR